MLAGLILLLVKTPSSHCGPIYGGKYFSTFIQQIFSRPYWTVIRLARIFAWICLSSVWEMCERQKYKYGIQRKAQKANPDQFHILKEKSDEESINFNMWESTFVSCGVHVCVFRWKAKLAFHKYPNAHYVAPWLRSNDVPCAIRNFILWMEKKGKLCHSATKTKYHVHLCNCANVQLCTYVLYTNLWDISIKSRRHPFLFSIKHYFDLKKLEKNYITHQKKKFD